MDQIVPEYPFQHIVMDHFVLNNRNYRVFANRFTNWPSVYMGDCSMDVCKVLAQISEDYGIPETLTTDGGKTTHQEKSNHFSNSTEFCTESARWPTLTPTAGWSSPSSQ